MFLLNYSHSCILSVLCLLLWLTTSDGATCQLPEKGPNETYTPEEAHAAWQQLADRYPRRCHVSEAGPSDAGEAIRLVVLGANEPPEALEQRKKPVLLVLNAIHPGEPCGVDASIRWAARLLDAKDPILDQMRILIVPFYNIGGGLNRHCCFRANQVGPEEHGFRGNCRNLDLNRDFVKVDALNTRTFQDILRRWDPDLFVDTHTTNGADYAYPMTLIPTQPDKLGGTLGEWLRTDLLPALYEGMNRTDTPMSPYVNTKGKTPESGLVDFLETPRYSTGYAALFQTVGFVSEAHMLKPFAERVKATENLLDLIAREGVKRGQTLLQKRRETRRFFVDQRHMPIRWALDTTRYDRIEFKGYEARTRPSEVSGLPRLYYDRARPWTDTIRYYNRYVVTDSASKPYAYFIPQAWREVIERLRWSGVKLRYLDADMGAPFVVDFLENVSSPRAPYEGHYLHDTVTTRSESGTYPFRRGDVIVEMGGSNARAQRFIAEVLEPKATDSYVAWNFFDAVLMQKEWFSDYLFEDTAAALLKRNPHLQAALDSARQADPALRDNSWQQLYFIYRRSDYYEATHRRYPVMRMFQPVAFPYYEDIRQLMESEE